MRVKRLDTTAVRVLAHPLRVRIVGSLRREGPATATVLAARLGASSGLTSYHVRVLADAGFVEEDTEHESSGRQRWWRSAHDMTSWRTGELRGDPDAEAAEQWLTGVTARAAIERIDDWLDRRPTTDPAWVDVSETDDYLLELSPDELRELLAEVNGVFRRWLEAPKGPSPERQQVEIVLAAFPRAPSP